MSRVNDGVKQRVVGALVLLCLAVIFLPWVFDSKREKPIDLRSQVPDSPEPPRFSVAAPIEPVSATTTKPIALQFQPQDFEKEEIETIKTAERLSLEAEANNKAAIDDDIGNLFTGNQTPSSEKSGSTNQDVNTANNNPRQRGSTAQSTSSSQSTEDIAAPIPTPVPSPTIALVKVAPAPETNDQKLPLKTNSQGFAISWVVQVVSYTEKNKAEKLAKQLRDNKYDAFVEPRRIEGKQVYRVYVGPKLLRDDAVALQKNLDKQLNVKSLVLKFSP